MVEMYRCKNCGYFHTGPAPDVCPVCGAPRSFFLPYAGPGDLTGTKTLENLKAAFAGESQANRRYLLWARIAELEGASDAVKAFTTAAAEETAHAFGHLAYMGGAKTTRDNLLAARDGEDQESRDMYPAFAEAAEAEGLPEIAYFFRHLAGFEGAHRDAYDAALAEFEK